MKKIYFIILLFLLSGNLVAKDSNKKVITAHTYLQARKNVLEVQKLKQEIKTIGYTPWLQSGTLIAALIAAGISLFTAIRSQRIQSKSLNNQVHQQERERISNLLKELGSEHIPVKIAAIQALSEYETSFPLIINSLRNETNQGVISLISKVLKKNTKLCIPILTEEISVLQQEKMNIASALLMLNIDRKEVCSKLDLVNEQLQEWFKTKYNQRNLSKNNFDFVSPNIEVIEESRFNELEESWKKIIRAYNNLATVLEELFKLASLNNEKYLIRNGFFNNFRFVDLNLEDWEFENCNFINTSFINCNLKNVHFKSIIGQSIVIKDSNVNSFHIINSKIKVSSFINSKGKNLRFKDSIFYNVDFSGSNIRYSSYSYCKIAECNLEASMWAKSTFDKIDFFSCNFEASYFQESVYKQVSIVKSKIKTTKFTKSNFCDSRFFVVDVERSNFKDSIFTSVKTNKIECVRSNFDRVHVLSSQLRNTNADQHCTFIDFLID